MAKQSRPSRNNSTRSGGQSRSTSRSADRRKSSKTTSTRARRPGAGKSSHKTASTKGKPAKPRSAPSGGSRDDQHGIRLNKALAEAGVGSRRACDQLIEEFRVSVNGEIVTKNPVWVDPRTDRIEVDGSPLPTRHRHSDLFYAMVYKPRGVICTADDPQGRPIITDLVPAEQRLFCVGRLDADSTGLVLLTNDGELCNRLTHPRYEIPKTYRVTLTGRLEGPDAEKLREGLWLTNKTGKTFKASADYIKILARDRDRTRLEIVLTEGRNREIRRMIAKLGHDVKRLQRTAIGPLSLQTLRPGHWRPLDPNEVKALRRAAGL